MSGGPKRPSTYHRLVGGAVAALASGAAVGLFVAFQELTSPATSDIYYSWAIGSVLLAVGAVGWIMYTVGLALSILIDRLLQRPTASIATHLLTGAAVGTGVVWLLADELTTWGAIIGAAIGSVNAAVAVAIARARPEGAWTQPAVLLVGAVGVVGIILLSAA